MTSPTFKNNDDVHVTSDNDNDDSDDDDGQSNNRDHLHLCIWASNKLDGQKSIWLQQVKYLDPSRSKFSFTWILTTDVTNNQSNTVLHQLNQLNVTVVATPFNNNPISIDSLSEDPLDGTLPASEVWVSKYACMYESCKF